MHIIIIITVYLQHACEVYYYYLVVTSTVSSSIDQQKRQHVMVATRATSTNGTECIIISPIDVLRS